MTDLQIVDVRNPGETAAGTDPETRSPSRWASCPPGSASSTPREPTVVYCAGGYRSSVAASLLRQQRASPT